MTVQNKAEQLEQELGQFIGTVRWYRWSVMFREMLCTDGVKYLAERAGAYWLLDAIAAHQSDPAIKASERLRAFQVWVLRVDGNAARLECLEDADQAPVIVQEIERTDFPLKEITLYCQNNVILLPSEY